MLNVESGKNPDAVSSAGARGLWQIMPDTAAGLSRQGAKVDPNDPYSSAEGGLRILRDNYQRFREFAKNERHAWMLAVAGYHTNPDNVENDLKRGGYGLPNISDGNITTRDHVLKVFKNVDSRGLNRIPQQRQRQQQQQQQLASSAEAPKFIAPEGGVSGEMPTDFAVPAPTQKPAPMGRPSEDTFTEAMAKQSAFLGKALGGEVTPGKEELPLPVAPAPIETDVTTGQVGQARRERITPSVKPAPMPKGPIPTGEPMAPAQNAFYAAPSIYTALGEDAPTSAVAGRYEFEQTGRWADLTFLEKQANVYRFQGSNPKDIYESVELEPGKLGAPRPVDDGFMYTAGDNQRWSKTDKDVFTSDTTGQRIRRRNLPDGTAEFEAISLPPVLPDPRQQGANLTRVEDKDTPAGWEPYEDANKEIVYTGIDKPIIPKKQFAAYQINQERLAKLPADFRSTVTRKPEMNAGDRQWEYEAFIKQYSLPDSEGTFNWFRNNYDIMTRATRQMLMLPAMDMRGDKNTTKRIVMANNQNDLPDDMFRYVDSKGNKFISNGLFTMEEKSFKKDLADILPALPSWYSFRGKAKTISVEVDEKQYNVWRSELGLRGDNDEIRQAFLNSGGYRPKVLAEVTVRGSEQPDQVPTTEVPTIALGTGSPNDVQAAVNATNAKLQIEAIARLQNYARQNSRPTKLVKSKTSSLVTESTDFYSMSDDDYDPTANVFSTIPMGNELGTLVAETINTKKDTLDPKLTPQQQQVAVQRLQELNKQLAQAGLAPVVDPFYINATPKLFLNGTAQIIAFQGGNERPDGLSDAEWRKQIAEKALLNEGYSPEEIARLGDGPWTGEVDTFGRGQVQLTYGNLNTMRGFTEDNIDPTIVEKFKKQYASARINSVVKALERDWTLRQNLRTNISPEDAELMLGASSWTALRNLYEGRSKEEFEARRALYEERYRKYGGNISAQNAASNYYGAGYVDYKPTDLNDPAIVEEASRKAQQDVYAISDIYGSIREYERKEKTWITDGLDKTQWDGALAYGAEALVRGIWYPVKHFVEGFAYDGMSGMIFLGSLIQTAYFNLQQNILAPFRSDVDAGIYMPWEIADRQSLWRLIEANNIARQRNMGWDVVDDSFGRASFRAIGQFAFQWATMGLTPGVGVSAGFGGLGRSLGLAGASDDVAINALQRASELAGKATLTETGLAVSVRREIGQILSNAGLDRKAIGRFFGAFEEGMAGSKPLLKTAGSWQRSVADDAINAAAQSMDEAAMGLRGTVGRTTQLGTTEASFARGNMSWAERAARFTTDLEQAKKVATLKTMITVGPAQGGEAMEMAKQRWGDNLSNVGYAFVGALGFLIGGYAESFGDKMFINLGRRWSLIDRLTEGGFSRSVQGRLATYAGGAFTGGFGEYVEEVIQGATNDTLSRFAKPIEGIRTYDVYDHANAIKQIFMDSLPALVAGGVGGGGGAIMQGPQGGDVYKTDFKVYSASSIKGRIAAKSSSFYTVTDPNTGEEYVTNNKLYGEAVDQLNKEFGEIEELLAKARNNTITEEEQQQLTTLEHRRVANLARIQAIEETMMYDSPYIARFASNEQYISALAYQKMRERLAEQEGGRRQTSEELVETMLQGEMKVAIAKQQAPIIEQIQALEAQKEKDGLTQEQEVELADLQERLKTDPKPFTEEEVAARREDLLSRIDFTVPLAQRNISYQHLLDQLTDETLSEEERATIAEQITRISDHMAEVKKAKILAGSIMQAELPTRSQWIQTLNRHGRDLMNLLTGKQLEKQVGKAGEKNVEANQGRVDYARLQSAILYSSGAYAADINDAIEGIDEETFATANSTAEVLAKAKNISQQQAQEQIDNARDAIIAATRPVLEQIGDDQGVSNEFWDQYDSSISDIINNNETEISSEEAERQINAARQAAYRLASNLLMANQQNSSEFAMSRIAQTGIEGLDTAFEPEEMEQQREEEDQAFEEAQFAAEVDERYGEIVKEETGEEEDQGEFVEPVDETRKQIAKRAGITELYLKRKVSGETEEDIDQETETEYEAVEEEQGFEEMGEEAGPISEEMEETTTEEVVEEEVQEKKGLIARARDFITEAAERRRAKKAEREAAKRALAEDIQEPETPLDFEPNVIHEELGPVTAVETFDDGETTLVRKADGTEELVKTSDLTVMESDTVSRMTAADEFNVRKRAIQNLIHYAFMLERVRAYRTRLGVELNDEGMVFITTMLGDIGLGDALVDGLFLKGATNTKASQVDRLIIAIDAYINALELQPDTENARAALEQLRNTIGAARGVKSGAVQLMSTKESISHERFHYISFLRAAGTELIDRHSKEGIVTLMQSDPARRAWAVFSSSAYLNFYDRSLFAEDGYDTYIAYQQELSTGINSETGEELTEDEWDARQRYVSKRNHVVGDFLEEMAVYSADGNYEHLGLTADEAAQYLDTWFTSYEAQNKVNIRKDFGKERNFINGLQKAVRKANRNYQERGTYLQSGSDVSIVEAIAAEDPTADDGGDFIFEASDEETVSKQTRLTPTGGKKLSRTSITSADRRGIPITQRYYQATTAKDVAAVVDRILDLGLEDATTEFFQRAAMGDTERGVSTVLGDALARIYGERGDLEMMDLIDDTLQSWMTELGQAIAHYGNRAIFNPQKAARDLIRQFEKLRGEAMPTNLKELVENNAKRAQELVDQRRDFDIQRQLLLDTQRQLLEEINAETDALKLIEELETRTEEQQKELDALKERMKYDPNNTKKKYKEQQKRARTSGMTQVRKEELKSREQDNRRKIAEMFGLPASSTDETISKMIADPKRAIVDIANRLEQNIDTVSKQVRAVMHGSSVADIHRRGGLSTTFVGSGTNRAFYGWGINVTDMEELADIYRRRSIRSRSRNGSDLGAVYNLELMPTEGDMLEVVKPFSEQNEFIQEQLTKDRFFAEWFAQPGSQIAPMHMFLTWLGAKLNTRQGVSLLTAAGMDVNAQRLASMYLLASNIRGTAFPTSLETSQGIETGRGYVVFDDADLAIIGVHNFVDRSLFFSEINKPALFSAIANELGSRWNQTRTVPLDVGGLEIGVGDVLPSNTIQMPYQKLETPVSAPSILGKSQLIKGLLADTKDNTSKLAEQLKDLVGDDLMSALEGEMAPDVTSKMIVGATGIARIAESDLPQAKWAQRRQLQLPIAKAMSRAYLPKKAIWLATGWYTGPDRQWRTEIGDPPMKTEAQEAWINGNLNEWLENVLEEGEYKTLLFAAYPELKMLQVQSGLSSLTTASARVIGQYLPKIEVSIDIAQGGNNNFDYLFHEIQHVIQGIEGFAPGGSTSAITKKQNYSAALKETRDFLKTVQKSYQQVKDALQAYDEGKTGTTIFNAPLWDLYQHKVGNQTEYTEEDLRIWMEEHGKWSKSFYYGNNINGISWGKVGAEKEIALLRKSVREGNLDTFEIYQRLGGETESRMVQARNQYGLIQRYSRSSFAALALQQNLDLRSLVTSESREVARQAIANAVAKELEKMVLLEAGEVREVDQQALTKALEQIANTDWMSVDSQSFDLTFGPFMVLSIAKQELDDLVTAADLSATPTGQRLLINLYATVGVGSQTEWKLAALKVRDSLLPSLKEAAQSVTNADLLPGINQLISYFENQLTTIDKNSTHAKTLDINVKQSFDVQEALTQVIPLETLRSQFAPFEMYDKSEKSQTFPPNITKYRDQYDQPSQIWRDENGNLLDWEERVDNRGGKFLVPFNPTGSSMIHNADQANRSTTTDVRIYKRRGNTFSVEVAVPSAFGIFNLSTTGRTVKYGKFNTFEAAKVRAWAVHTAPARDMLPAPKAGVESISEANTTQEAMQAIAANPRGALEEMAQTFIESETVSKAIRALHGSAVPNIDRLGGFQSSYMSTGEGAQAFGWGHYFSDLLDVATDYRTSNYRKWLSRNPLSKIGAKFDGLTLDRPEVVADLISLIKDHHPDPQVRAQWTANKNLSNSNWFFKMLLREVNEFATRVSPAVGFQLKLEKNINKQQRQIDELERELSLLIDVADGKRGGILVNERIVTAIENLLGLDDFSSITRTLLPSTQNILVGLSPQTLLDSVVDKVLNSDLLNRLKLRTTDPPQSVSQEDWQGLVNLINRFNEIKTGYDGSITLTNPKDVHMNLFTVVNGLNVALIGLLTRFEFQRGAWAESVVKSLTKMDRQLRDFGKLEDIFSSAKFGVNLLNTSTQRSQIETILSQLQREIDPTKVRLKQFQQLDEAVKAYGVDRFAARFTVNPDIYEGMPEEMRVRYQSVGAVYEAMLNIDDTEWLKLDEDLSGQSDFVLTRLADNKFYKLFELDPNAGFYKRGFKQGSMYQFMKWLGDHFNERAFQEAANSVTTNTRGDRLASMYLLALGIKGNKYLTGGTRLGYGKQDEPAYNYVVFDDGDVSIVGIHDWYSEDYVQSQINVDELFTQLADQIGKHSSKSQGIKGPERTLDQPVSAPSLRPEAILLQQALETPPVTGRETVSKMLVGEKGLTRLSQAQTPQGRKAQRQLANLDVAKQMLAKDADPAAIWVGTGWEMGKDGLWRSEIDEDILLVPEMKDPKWIKKPKLVVLEDLFVDSPYKRTLFSMYPQLRGVIVDFKSDQSVGGWWQYTTGKLFVSTTWGAEYLRGTLFHEIQHAVQSAEGFQPGSNWSEFKSFGDATEKWNAFTANSQRTNRALDELVNNNLGQVIISEGLINPYTNARITQRLVDTLVAAGGRSSGSGAASFKWRKGDVAATVFTEPELRALQGMYSAFTNSSEGSALKFAFDRENDLAGGVDTHGIKGAKNLYHHTAGEVEARTTEVRSGERGTLTPKFLKWYKMAYADAYNQFLQDHANDIDVQTRRLLLHELVGDGITYRNSNYRYKITEESRNALKERIANADLQPNTAFQYEITYEPAENETDLFLPIAMIANLRQEYSKIYHHGPSLWDVISDFTSASDHRGYFSNPDYAFVSSMLSEVRALDKFSIKRFYTPEEIEDLRQLRSKAGGIYTTPGNKVRERLDLELPFIDQVLANVMPMSNLPSNTISGSVTLSDLIEKAQKTTIESSFSSRQMRQLMPPSLIDDVDRGQQILWNRQNRYIGNDPSDALDPTEIEWSSSPNPNAPHLQILEASDVATGRAKYHPIFETATGWEVGTNGYFGTFTDLDDAKIRSATVATYKEKFRSRTYPKAIQSGIAKILGDIEDVNGESVSKVITPENPNQTSTEHAAMTMDKATLLARIPEEERMFGEIKKGVPATANGKRFSDLDLEDGGRRFKLTDSDILRFMEEAEMESTPGARSAARELRAAGRPFFPQNAKYWVDALAGSNRSRFWYEISAEAFRRVFPDLGPNEMRVFMSFVAATSPKADPYNNLRRAIGAYAEYMQQVPIETDLLNPGILQDAALTDLEGLKIGNFGNTFTWLQGLEDNIPLPTNDTHVATTFQIKPTDIPSKSAIYETMSRFTIKLAAHINQQLQQGAIPYQPWQIQALGWVHERDIKRPGQLGDDYAMVLDNILLPQLREAGLISGDTITRETFMDPRLPDLMSPTRNTLRSAATAEVPLLEPASAVGQKANELLLQLAALNNPEITASFITDTGKPDSFAAIRERSLEDLTTKRQAQKGLASQLASIVANKSVAITRIGRSVHITSEGAADAVSIPLSILSAGEREVFYAIFGDSIGNSSIDAAQFIPADWADEPAPGTTRSAVVFVDRVVLPQEQKAFRDALNTDIKVAMHPNGTAIKIVPTSSFVFDLDTVKQAIGDTLGVAGVSIGAKDVVVEQMPAEYYEPIVNKFVEDLKTNAVTAITSLRTSKDTKSVTPKQVRAYIDRFVKAVAANRTATSIEDVTIPSLGFNSTSQQGRAERIARGVAERLYNLSEVVRYAQFARESHDISISAWNQRAETEIAFQKGSITSQQRTAERSRIKAELAENRADLVNRATDAAKRNPLGSEDRYVPLSRRTRTRQMQEEEGETVSKQVNIANDMNDPRASQIDAETMEALVEVMSLELSDGINNGMSVWDFIQRVRTLTNNRLSTETIMEVHKRAVKENRATRGAASEESKRAQKVRNEHYKAADLFAELSDEDLQERALDLYGDIYEQGVQRKARITELQTTIQGLIDEQQGLLQELRNAMTPDERNDINANLTVNRAKLHEYSKELHTLERTKDPNINVIVALLKQNLSPDVFTAAFMRMTNSVQQTLEWLATQGFNREEALKILQDADGAFQKAQDSLKAKAKRKKMSQDATEEDLERLERQEKAHQRERQRQAAEEARLRNIINTPKWLKRVAGILDMRRATLLNHLKTWGINITSTFANVISDFAVKLIAEATDIVASKVTGLRTTAFDIKAALNGFRSLFASDDTLRALGRSSGIGMAVDIIRNGDVDALATLQLAESNVALGETNPISKGFWRVADAYINYNFRFLGAQDALFKAYIFRKQLEELAEVMGKNADPQNWREKKAELMQNPTQAMAILAMEEAENICYQSPNALSKWWANTKASAYQKGGGWAAIAESTKYPIPYDRTPVNIFLQTFTEFSPIGFVRAFRALKRALKGPNLNQLKDIEDRYLRATIEDMASDAAFLQMTPEEQRAELARMLNQRFTFVNQRDFARLFGRATTGTAAFFLGYLLAAAGMLTGADTPPDDPDERDEYFERKREGKKPFMLLDLIQLPFAPMFMMMGYGASVAEEQRRREEADGDYGKWYSFQQGLGSVGETFVEQTRGVPLVNAVLGDLRSKWTFGSELGQGVSTLIPFSRWLDSFGQIEDETERVRGPLDVEGEGPIDRLLPDAFNNVATRLPFARHLVPEKEEGMYPEYRGDRMTRFMREFDPFAFNYRNALKIGPYAEATPTPKPQQINPEVKKAEEYLRRNKERQKSLLPSQQKSNEER